MRTDSARWSLLVILPTLHQEVLGEILSQIAAPQNDPVLAAVPRDRCR